MKILEDSLQQFFMQVTGRSGNRQEAQPAIDDSVSFRWPNSVD